MAYTDEQIRQARLANNVPDNYVTVRTTSGGFVFVDPNNTATLTAYRTGKLTGGPAENAVGGVALRVLPQETPVAYYVAQNQQQTQPQSVVQVINTTPPATPRPTTPSVKKTAQVPIFIEIIAKPPTIKSAARIEVEISPAEFPQQTKNVQYNFSVNTRPIQINLSEPIIVTAEQFLRDIIDVYVDEERELKTLLNYGEDKQSVVLGYRKGPIDINGIESIQLKLLQPVPDEVTINTPVFLGREVAKTVIDKVRVRFTPPLDATPYLRPKNLKVKADLDTGKFVKNVTLNKLSLQSGSVGRLDPNQNKTFEDEIFRQWYSYDFNSSELNIDFTNYENFVFYSSAAMRLAAFKQKLQQIERLERSRNQILAAYTANTASAGYVYIQEKTAEYALEKEDIIRSFDRYEQYLFFTPSGSTNAYSASFDYVDGGTEYNAIGYWPKSGSDLYAVSSEVATEWYDTQLAIAQRFDEFNENNLINTIPSYLQQDDSSAAYLTFVSMVGQLFDNIKLYIDHFPDVYSRNINPNEELSKDLINEIAESMGFVLPSLDSVYNLTDNILGSTDKTPRRDLSAEIYKRLLHNLPFFAKSKGTKTALQTFLNTFGVTPQLLSVRETGTPASSSFRIFDEYTTGLDFDETKTSYIRLPISASSRNPQTLQFNCTVAKNKTMTILTGDNRWALNVTRHPTIETLGRFEIASGSTNTAIVTSSYYPIFGDELFNVTIKNYSNTSSFYFTQVDGEDILFNQIVKNNTFSQLWNDTQYVFIGGAGSRVQGRYDGTIDEVRLWGIPLSDEVILNTAFDPASNAGDVYSDPVNYLYVQLSFNKILLDTTEIQNESPYKNKTNTPSLESLFLFNITESDFIRYSRTIKQYVPIAGSNSFVTNKISVVEEPKFISDSNGLRLYRNKSIVAPETKKFNKGRNKVILAVSPTDIVNQNIIRNLGLENINAVLGAPTTLYTTFEKSLTTLKNHYQQYHYVDVNTNSFIRILSDLSSVINQVVDYFIPSKATLLKGVIIEPNILEQVKVPPVKNIRFYGKNTKKTLDAPGSLTGSNADYGATFNLSKTITQPQPTASAQYPTYVGQTNNTEVLNLSSTYDVHTGTFEISNQSYTTASYITYKTVLDNTLQEINAELDRYSTVAQYKGDIDRQPTNITSSVNSIVTELEGRTYEITSSFETINTTINVDDVSLEDSGYETYKIQHRPWDHKGVYKDKDVRIDTKLSNLNKIPYNDVNNGNAGAEPYNRLYTRKLFTEEIETTRLGGNTSIYVPALYDIPPSADFRDFGVYTYFSAKEGIYYFNEIKKIPAYANPLNATWDFANQTFGNTAANWAYGKGYNKYDVVYQNVTDDTLKLTGITGQRTASAEYLRAKTLVKSANAGNGKYYVFKTRPSYTNNTVDGTFFSGSVPSYIPPSLDKTNWDVLRFKPIQVRLPRRVVFDTYTVSNLALTNFKTTTISIDKNINIPDRFVDSFNLGNISPNSYITGELSVQNLAVLFAIQTNVSGLRIRLYRTETTRTNDISRGLQTKPEGSHGVILDAIINQSNTVELANPIPTLTAGEFPPAGKIFYTIDNLDSTGKSSINLLLYYFAIEIEPRIPTGYLRKHYRFFRDNTTATKRRNYLGCKNTVDTTVDGLPPIQVFIGEGTEIQVSPSTLNQEIITGGGGTLNVT